jgi:hypothetical protein
MCEQLDLTIYLEVSLSILYLVNYFYHLAKITAESRFIFSQNYFKV